ncbi:MAG: cytochrome c biogenesis protein CcsA [Planctomycetaceae bacterium]
MLSNVTVYCFLASYVIVLICELVRWLKRSSLNRVVILGLGCAGLVAQTAYLWQRGLQTDLPPLMASSHDWLLVLSWTAIVLYLFVSLIDKSLAVGPFLLPLVIVLIIGALLVSDQPQTIMFDDPDLSENVLKRWGMLHATLLMFGAGGVMAGCILGLMYLVQHRRLKHKQILHEGLTLPSLAKLARWNWWAGAISFPLLTLGMLVGVGMGWYKQQGSQPVSFADPVIIGYGVVWIVMLVLFFLLVRTRHPGGRQVAWWTIWAFTFLLVTVLGLQILTKGVSSLNSWHAGRADLSSHIVSRLS